MDVVDLTIDGAAISAPAGSSVIEAAWAAGLAQIEGVGCLGGSCGSCRIMVRRPEGPEVRMQLACETVIEAGLQVTFLGHLDFRGHHAYRIEDFGDPWEVLGRVERVFKEARHCRHCGGCDAACPRGIEVERAVDLAVAGKIVEAGDLFETCVMCNLCTRACPEHIGPNHLGLLCRRLTAVHSPRPANLLLRLEQLRRGELTVVTEDRAPPDDHGETGGGETGGQVVTSGQIGAG